MTTDFWLWNFLDLDPGPRGPVLFPRVMTTAQSGYFSWMDLPTLQFANPTIRQPYSLPTLQFANPTVCQLNGLPTLDFEK